MFGSRVFILMAMAIVTIFASTFTREIGHQLSEKEGSFPFFSITAVSHLNISISISIRKTCVNRDYISICITFSIFLCLCLCSCCEYFSVNRVYVNTSVRVIIPCPSTLNEKSHYNSFIYKPALNVILRYCSLLLYTRRYYR